ncbi:MAG: ABC transporter permease [Verrucomicrobia bacterium]|nr:ABC transporter permease [Verrucomicrobiota bacterium]
MRYAWLIAVREYVENAKTKGFWIGLLLFPAILFLSIQVPILLEKKGSPTRYFVLVDQSGEFEGVVDTAVDRHQQWQLLRSLTDYATKNSRAQMKSGKGVDLESVPAPGGGAIEEFLDAFAETNPQALDRFSQQGGQEAFLKQVRPYLKTNAPPFEVPKQRFGKVPLPDGVSAGDSLTNIARGLRPYLRGERKITVDGKSVDLYAAVLIPKDVAKRIVRPGQMAHLMSKERGVEYWSGNLADLALRNEIERGINAEVRRREYTAKQIDVQTIRQVERTHAPFSNLNPKKEEGKEGVSMADYIRQFAPSGFVYLLWVAIFSIAQMLLNNTIEEKSNRIIEVLLSSVTPGELMLGKLMGIAGIGLTMIGSWILALVGVLLWKAGPQLEFAQQLLEVLKTSNLLPWFAFYFLCGYVLYAGVILALGSVCNTIKEAQNFMGVITVVMMVPLFTLTFIPKDPNGPIARVLSWIPCYTPFTMMNRATADPPLVDQVGTVILMLVSAGASIWLSSKVFRIGILRTGQPPRVIEMIRWIKGGSH